MNIQGYPNYLIYDDGRIWSKPRKNLRGCQVKGRFLKPHKDRNGYYQVQLSRDGVKKRFFVSRLIALNFIPNPENKPEVDHIDRNPLNNHVSNLRWVTRQENVDNKGMTIRNTSGHTGISYRKSRNRWRFQYNKRGHNVSKAFTTKQDAIHYKFFFLLKLNLQRE